MSRFDSVKYGDISISHQDDARVKCSILESFIMDKFKPSRAQSLALTKLEECHMWIGKMIRDEQIERNKEFFAKED